MGFRLFFQPPPAEPDVTVSNVIRLSSNSYRDLLRQWLARVDSHMTRRAEYQRLPSANDHDFRPIRKLSPSFAFQVRKFADMVNFYLPGCSTDFTLFGEKSLHQFRTAWTPDRNLVTQNCLLLSS